MYKITDAQIDFILNDISARGVEMDDLQQSLLDHVCCIIEQNLEENGDFEAFYSTTIKTFYKNYLWEIEEETISLLTFKNYYAMKKSMLISGTIAVSFLAIGIFFKFMHWPVANISIVLGIGLLSLVFLPLMFILKIKEKKNLKDKLIILSGAISGILICLGILFKLQHWPYANMMMSLSMAVMLLLFLPFYFFSGIRNPETKVNTIVSSIILIAICGLLLALIRSPRSTQIKEHMMTESYLKNQFLLQNELLAISQSTVKSLLSPSSNQLMALCEELKSKIIELNTDSRTLAVDFYSKGIVIADHAIDDVFNNPETVAIAEKMTKLANQYRLSRINTSSENSATNKLSSGTFIEHYQKRQITGMSAYEALNQLTQIQLLILQNERGLLAMNN